LDTLTESCAAGRLTLAEFSERAGRVHAAVTAADLEAELADLVPATDASTGTGPAIVPPVATPRRRRWSLSLIGDLILRGRYRLPERTYFLTGAGDASLTLSAADLQARVSTVTVIGLFSDLRVQVPPGIDVEVGGIALMGHRHIAADSAPAVSGAPLIRLRLITLIGDLRVKRSSPTLPGGPAADGDGTAPRSGVSVWPFTALFRR
jgi:hypothetical protein